MTSLVIDDFDRVIACSASNGAGGNIAARSLAQSFWRAPKNAEARPFLSMVFDWVRRERAPLTLDYLDLVEGTACRFRLTVEPAALGLRVSRDLIAVGGEAEGARAFDVTGETEPLARYLAEHSETLADDRFIAVAAAQLAPHRLAVQMPFLRLVG